MPPEDLVKDFEERRAGFLAEYKTLIDKYRVDFLSTPVLVPTANGTWSLQELAFRVDIVDTKNMPTKSPLQFQSIQM